MCKEFHINCWIPKNRRREKKLYYRKGMKLVVIHFLTNYFNLNKKKKKE